MKRLIGPLVFVVLTGLSFGTDETFALKQLRHVGHVEKFHLVLDAPGKVIIRYESTDSYKISKVDAKSNYTIEDNLIRGFRNLGGTIEKFPKQDPNNMTYSSLGEAVRPPVPAGSDFLAVNELQSHVYEFVPDHPVKIGESWSHTAGMVSVECSLVGHIKLGKIDCLKIAMTMKLNKEKYPGSTKETVWLRAKDFSLQKLDARTEGAEYTSNLPMSMNKNHMTIDRL